MKIKSLQDSKTYHSQHAENWRKILQDLDSTLAEARDQGKAPIYLTKTRIKQPESAYFKFKRKQRVDPKTITDWIGLRVLCLFQQDIEPTYQLLLKIMFQLHPLSGGSSYHFKLKEVNIFNWPKENANRLGQLLKGELNNDSLKSTIKDTADGFDVAFNIDGSKSSIPFKLKYIQKGSGYQSVHFVVEITRDTNEAAQCEIQLRTLLQDVWGELEHALAYKKGKIHPHIQNSFELLSQELAAKDSLVSQLRKIRDEESAFSHYANISAGPNSLFSYPASYLERLFHQTSEQEFFAKYQDCCRTRKDTGSTHNFIADSTQLLDQLSKSIEVTPCDNGEYFLAMERAFLAYCSGDLARAEKSYRFIIEQEKWENRWYPYFRLGEVCLALDKVEDALVAFDECEERMKGIDPGSTSDKYHAKVGLAYSYWSLGKEFLPTVIVKMEEAKVVADEYLQNGSLCEEERIRMKFSLANNLCYYYLEHWLATPDTADVDHLHSRSQRADQEFHALEKLAKDHPKNAYANAYDTMAWYCFQYSQKVKDPVKASDFLILARDYIVSCDGASNRAPSRLTSTSIQREHIQTIMSRCP